MNEVAFQNERGRITVLECLLHALVEQAPQIGRAGLANVERLRDQLVNTTQPEAFLAGVDFSARAWALFVQQAEAAQAGRTGG